MRKRKLKFFERLNKYQKILILIIAVYTIISFVRLGNLKSPKTFLNLKNEEYIVYKLEEDKVPKSMALFVGNDNVYLSIFLAEKYSPTNEDFQYDTSITTAYGDVFSWKKENININREKVDYIMVSSYWDSTTLGEIAFLDDEENIIKTSVIEGSNLLTDEQDTIQLEKNYLNSTYFDEIYFPRASYEIFNNKYIFEFTHPPLGKILMWIPMALFGISPFSYRLMGNIAGILMILIMYKIAKELFKDERYALFAASIITLDGMHFAQTRIATVDSFLVLFSMLAVLFFIKYLKEKDGKKRFKLLAISGIMWGCAISVKWTPAYLGIGLGIVFFFDYFVNQKVIINKRFNYKPILMGIVCFVFLPILVYLASYIPIYGNENEGAAYDVIDANGNKITEVAKPDSINGFFMYQYAMFQYHSNIGKGDDYTPHPFASDWYTWPAIYKPMWFYSNNYDNGIKSTIATMGNPVIWWLSIVTAIATIIYSIIKKDKVGIFIIILIACTWLPFAIISREMYIYHYFLTSVLMMLTIVFAVEKLCEWKSGCKLLIPIFTGLFLIAFIYFYPVYSGMIVSEKYIEATKWLSSWIY